MDNYDEPEVINVGGGLDVPIREVSQLIKDTVGYRGEIVFDPAKPDGAPQKLLDNSKATKLGWKATVSLEEGIRRTYKWYREKVQ